MAIQSLDKKTSVCFDLFLIALELTALGVSLFFNITLEEGEWFQRSGSLVVLLSVILEIRQSLAKQPQASPDVFVNGKPSLVDAETPTVRKLFHWIAWTGIVIGTLIWGYGDIFIDLLIK